MSEQPGSKTTTLTGGKRSELLTRQTDDGSFEIIVETGDDAGTVVQEAQEDNLVEDLHTPRRSRRRLGLIVPAAIGAFAVLGYVVVSISSGDSAQQVYSSVHDEIPGFRPYGGVGREVSAHAKPAAVAPKPDLADERVESVHDDFVDDSNGDLPAAIGAPAFQQEDQLAEEDWPAEESGRVDVRELESGMDVEEQSDVRFEEEFRPAVRPSLMNIQPEIKDLHPRLLRPDMVQAVRESVDGRPMPFDPSARLPAVEDEVVDEDYESGFDEMLEGPDEEDYLDSEAPQEEYDEWEETSVNNF